MPIAPETFFLDPNYSGTLQKQLQEIVTTGILSGRFEPNARLPSSRRLAEHLGISRITVTLAYSELLSNDYLTSRGRSGYFVSDQAPRPPRFATQQDRSDLPPVPALDWSKALGQRYSAYAGVTRPADWRSYRYPFIYGQTDPTLFDHHNWRQCALQALGQRDFAAMTEDYYERDDPKLIEYIARHILPRRGISADPDEILITMGAQNALWITAQILLTKSRTAATEYPTYPGLREILTQSSCTTVTLPVDKDGLPPDTIPRGVDVVYTTPSHHCPTNATMTLDRRNALLERSATEGFVVVEDDYEFELAFSRAPSPALKSLDRAGSVIYIGSFSKSLFPGLRLGFMVAAKPFVAEARSLRALVLRHPPGHIQRTAAYFLSLGHYDGQISKMGKTYKTRRAVMDKALRSHGLQFAGDDSQGGSCFWMRAPDGVNTHELAMDLRQDGVLIEPGDIFFDPNSPNTQHYRLAYSSIPAEHIPDGIALLAKRMRKLALS